MPNCNYVLKHNKQHHPWLDVEYSIQHLPDVLDLHYALWRPGRYEEGRYLRNVRGLKFFLDGQRYYPERHSLNHWQIIGYEGSKLEVFFQFYAKDFNAGSTHCGEEILYVNAPNIGLYAKQYENEKQGLQLVYPEKWNIAGALPASEDGHVFEFENIHHFFDTPFIAAPKIQQYQIELKGYLFYLHFHGDVELDLERIKKDFIAFMACQINDFGRFTVPEFHFIFLIAERYAYHGVEHLSSTVIQLGPGKDLMNSGYHPFLEISSHEFYHSWNVKSIRPCEWMPYDYNRISPSTLGYIAEGITTHMGDWYLLKAGVFNNEWFAKEMADRFTRYIQNYGRIHLSLADSSYETWVDGYEKGVPNRKVSIYNEGGILAFVLEYLIRKQSHNEKGLADLMQAMFNDMSIMQQGISSDGWYALLIEWIPNEAQDIFENYYHGTSDYRSYAYEAMTYFGYAVEEVPSDHYAEAKLGMKLRPDRDHLLVTDVYEPSYGFDAGLREGDHILLINKNGINEKEYEKQLQEEGLDGVVLTVKNEHHNRDITLRSTDRVFYKTAKVTILERDVKQRQAYNKFVGKK